jgi:AcrR family transcriptional regulator
MKILAAASLLFARDGVAETTVDQIAELAEVSDTTVYNYFTSKDELVDAFLMETHGAHGLAAMLAARPAKEGPIRALRGLFEDVDTDNVLSDKELQERRALLERAREDKLLWGAYLRTMADAVIRLRDAFLARAPKWDAGEALMAAHAALGVLQAVMDLQDDSSTFDSYRADSIAALARLEKAFRY